MEVNVAGCRAVRDHRHRQVGGVGRVIKNLHVEDGGQPTQPLCADPQRVDLFVEFEAQFFDPVFGSARLEFVDVDRIHQRFLGHQHGLFRRAADADAEDARRTPARPHHRHALQDPFDDVVRGVEHGKLGLGFRTAALGRTDDFDLVARNDFVVDDGRGVVLGVLAATGRVGQYRGAQRIVLVHIGATHAFVDHLLQAHRRAVPTHVHAHLEEDEADAGILAHRAMPFGREA